MDQSSLETSTMRKAIHKCRVCDYETAYSTAMKKHLSCVKPCGGVPCTDPIYQEMIDRYLNDTGKKKDKKIPLCKSCLKEFSCSASLSRHRKSCKGLPQLYDEVKHLREKVKAIDKDAKLKPQIINNNSITITNNIQNMNIHIKPFGKESIERFTNDIHFMNQCVRRRDKGFVEFLEQVHAAPENRNIKVSKSKPNYCLLFDGETWIYETKHEAADQMLQQGCSHLCNHYKSHQDSVPDYIKRHVKDFMYLVDKNDIDTMIILRNKIMNAVCTWGQTHSVSN